MSRWCLATLAYGLLVGLANVHRGFIRGPGEYFQSIFLLGVIGGFVLGFRQAKTHRFGRGAAYTFGFVACVCLPYLVWWGWLECQVRSVPLPPGTQLIGRHTEPTRFTGGMDWLVEGRVKLPSEVVETALSSLSEYRRDSSTKRGFKDAELHDARGETMATIEAFYAEQLVTLGWRQASVAELPGRNSLPVRERRVAFTRGGSTIELLMLPNTFDVVFLVQRKDPMPFGPVRLPHLPWTRPPTPPTPLPVAVPQGN